MRAMPFCEHHVVLLGEQKPDRSQTQSRHSARCARFPCRLFWPRHDDSDPSSITQTFLNWPSDFAELALTFPVESAFRQLAKRYRF